MQCRITHLLCGLPFSGCRAAGFWSWAYGCERQWPEFVRSFSALTLASFALSRWRRIAVSLTVLVAVFALLGGAYQLGAGLPVPVFEGGALAADWPLFLGALAGFCLGAAAGTFAQGA